MEKAAADNSSRKLCSSLNILKLNVGFKKKHTEIVIRDGLLCDVSFSWLINKAKKKVLEINSLVLKFSIESS